MEGFVAPSAGKNNNYPWFDFFPPEEKMKVGRGNYDAFVGHVNKIRNFK